MKTLKIFKTVFVLFAMLLALVSCWKKDEVILPEGAKDGDIVLVHYTLMSEEWEKIESSYDIWSPLEFELWGWGMISWFDKAVHSMKVWDKKTVTLLPEEAYWQRVEEAVQVVPKSELVEFEQMGVILEKWNTIPTMYWNLEILETDDESITIDMNHSMAGKTLTFDIELVEIKDKSETNNLPNFDLSTEEIDNIGELNNNIVE